MLAGIAVGSRRRSSGAPKATPVDFFDVKQDLEALFARTGASEEFGFVQIPCRACIRASARITRAARSIGWIGELHPQLVQEFDFTYAPICSKWSIGGARRQNAAF
jgi:phenylalanyl-tRNA synthetase beta chain